MRDFFVTPGIRALKYVQKKSCRYGQLFAKKYICYSSSTAKAEEASSKAF